MDTFKPFYEQRLRESTPGEMVAWAEAGNSDAKAIVKKWGSEFTVIFIMGAVVSGGFGLTLALS